MHVRQQARQCHQFLSLARHRAEASGDSPLSPSVSDGAENTPVSSTHSLKPTPVSLTHSEEPTPVSSTHIEESISVSSASSSGSENPALVSSSDSVDSTLVSSTNGEDSTLVSSSDSVDSTLVSSSDSVDSTSVSSTNSVDSTLVSSSDSVDSTLVSSTASEDSTLVSSTNSLDTTSASQPQSQGHGHSGIAESDTERQEPHSRHKRDLLSGWFIFPGTKWCGDGDIAEHPDDLGYDESLDSCCREHDRCKHVIPRVSWRYSLFNYRLHTLSHCRCDRRFRRCLKKSTSPAAHMVGKIYFNVIGPQCFKFTRTRSCKRRNWWGKCKKYGFTKVAHPKKQRSF